MVNVKATFPCETAAIGQARAFADGNLNACGRDPLVVALLTSELAANAVLHARTEFTVAVAAGPGRVRVGVSDGSTVLPAVTLPLPDVGGRGLQIVDTLATRWGADGTAVGKEVWFVLEAPDSPAP